MGQDVQLPDWAKQGPAQAFRGVNPFDDLLSEGIGRGYGVIGYKGKVWTLRTGGKVYNFTRADDGTLCGYIDVVILGQVKNKSRSYYPKVNGGYEDGGHARPVCASINGVTPDAGVQERQNANCALCPRAVRPAGGGQSECTEYKRLAVLLLPPQTERMLGGTPLMEPVFLRVPPDSLKNLAATSDMMAKAMFNYWSYVTRISFDPNKPHPCMLFEAKERLSDAEAPAIIEMRNDPLVGRITGADTVHNVTGADAVHNVTEGLPYQGYPLGDKITVSNIGNGAHAQITVQGPHITAADHDVRHSVAAETAPDFASIMDPPLKTIAAAVVPDKAPPQEASDALAERIAKLIKKPQ